ncbi:SAF domain-containing protein [Sanguibacter sp. 25GB23B1]|uniref:SAF domain-containing protein n=1 Tax=unclassified Sanguibacter TaxID=2645534 RepID=UPI0032AF0C48
MTTSTRSRTDPRTAVAPPAPPRVRRRLRAMAWRARFALAALALGAAATVTVHQLSPPRPASVSMVVADRALSAGTALTAADVRVVSVPPGSLPPDALREVGDVVGRTVAVNVTPGTVVSAPVLSTDLAAQAPPGTVIAAVRLAEPALADLLEPGMRVDLLAPSTQHPETGTSSEVPGQPVPGTYLARSAVVQPVPRSGSEAQGDGLLSLDTAESGGTGDLMLVAVTPDEAASLANMAGWSAISAVLVH